jgi:hypothetical protein
LVTFCCSFCRAFSRRELLTWAQIKSSLGVDGSSQLEEANLVNWFLDPDIQPGRSQDPESWITIRRFDCRLARAVFSCPAVIRHACEKILTQADFSLARRKETCILRIRAWSCLWRHASFEEDEKKKN